MLLAKEETISEASILSAEQIEKIKKEEELQRQIELFKLGFYNANSKAEIDFFNSVNSNEEFYNRMNSVNSAKSLFDRKKAVMELAKRGTISKELRNHLTEHGWDLSREEPHKKQEDE